jgi:hypothetical protein
MSRVLIASLFVLVLVLAVGQASAVTINSTTYTIANLGGDYFNPGTSGRNFYAYHLSDTGVVSGYTMQYYSVSGWPGRYGYPAIYSGGTLTKPFGSTSYPLNVGTMLPGNSTDPVVYAPVMRNDSGYWVYTDSSAKGHVLNPSGTDVTPGTWGAGYYINAINSSGLLGGGTDPGGYYTTNSTAGQLTTLTGTVKSPAPPGWVAAVNDAGLAVTEPTSWFGAFVNNTTGAATTYWGTGNVAIPGGGWYAPNAISQNGKYVVGMDSGNYGPYVYTATGLNAGSSTEINVTSLGVAEGGWATAVNNNGWVGGDTDANSSFYGKGFIWENGVLHNSDIQTMINGVSSGYTFCAVWGVSNTLYGTNSNPQILVWGRDSNGVMESFLLTPVGVPEPSTLLSLVSGLAGVLAYAWRKRK